MGTQMFDPQGLKPHDTGEPLRFEGIETACSPPDHDLILLLLREALSVFDDDRATARQRVVHACALAARHARAETHLPGSLAPWQVKRAEAHIRENLGSKLAIGDVAALARLSTAYFSRAFKATVGVSYTTFVIQVRIDRAKHLLLTTSTPICEIALICGLTDQSHLTRLFTRQVGLPPRAWRRLMLGGGAQDFDARACGFGEGLGDQAGRRPARPGLPADQGVLLV